MNLGIKIWSTNLDLISEINDLYNQRKIGFVEIYAVPDSFNSTIGLLKNIEVEKVIHCPHLVHSQFNIADKTKHEMNIKIFKEVQKFADELKAKDIIVHAGEEGDLKAALSFLKETNDPRILIENMPRFGINGEDCIGYDKKRLEPYLEIVKGICLDFSHAAKAACSLKIDYKRLIKELLELNPLRFHISDGFKDNPKDEHLNFGQGDLDVRYFLDCAGEKPLTLEIMRNNHDTLEEDLVSMGLIRNFKK